MIGPLSVQPALLLAITLGTTSSQTADRIHDVSYGCNFYLFFRLFFCIVFQFLFVWRECLAHQVPIVLTVLSFRFSGLCLMVVNATIHFHGQASPVGVWSFLSSSSTRRAVKKKITAEIGAGICRARTVRSRYPKKFENSSPDTARRRARKRPPKREKARRRNPMGRKHSRFDQHKECHLPPMFLRTRYELGTYFWQNFERP